MNTTVLIVLAIGAVALTIHLTKRTETFQRAVDSSTPWVETTPRMGTALCPYGTFEAWTSRGGSCCTPGGACTPAVAYQTQAPRVGDHVCPAGTTWGWGLLGGMCCGPSGCVKPLVQTPVR